MTIYYEIRIAGLVPAGALRGFGQLAAEQPTETMVRARFLIGPPCTGYWRNSNRPGSSSWGCAGGRTSQPARLNGSQRTSNRPAESCR
jgi:hypothetical protein